MSGVPVQLLYIYVSYVFFFCVGVERPQACSRRIRNCSRLTRCRLYSLVQLPIACDQRCALTHTLAATSSARCVRHSMCLQLSDCRLTRKWCSTFMCIFHCCFFVFDCLMRRCLYDCLFKVWCYQWIPPRAFSCVCRLPAVIVPNSSMFRNGVIVVPCTLHSEQDCINSVVRVHWDLAAASFMHNNPTVLVNCT